MSSYNFSNLSPADFEDLCRDLISKEIGIRLEAFANGPDEGIDGRHAASRDLTILQAKHYSGSSFSSLKNTMKLERRSIDKLMPSNYILATSRPLTPKNKKDLAEIIGPSLKIESNIFGPDDLSTLLRKYPEVEKTHIKLWLTSATILNKIIHSASHTYNTITQEEIEFKSKIFVSNPSMGEGRDILEKNHILIISGPSGVGKTTLAEMLSYTYIAQDNWELNSIRSLEDGFSSINDKKRQIFLFDDFLGKISLDKHALSKKDSELYKFLHKISNSPNARFILTTRANIFEEARLNSEYLSNHLLEISKYTLDVGIYTRRIRARILYNHIIANQLGIKYIETLIRKNALKQIIDHKNYNPRIIEWMTSRERYENIVPDQYLESFIKTLNNPRKLWDHSFRHLPKKCQHLLFTLFFCSEYGVSIDSLKLSYTSLHQHFSHKFNATYNPKDFEESVKILEGGFISISDKSVKFINPSLKDYLSEYLCDVELIFDFPECAEDTHWARSVWRFGEKIIPDKKELKKYALSFLKVAKKFPKFPVWGKSNSGISNTGRITILLEWWAVTRCNDFAELATCIAKKPIDGLSSWRDGEDVIRILDELREEEDYRKLQCAEELIVGLEDSFVKMLENPIPSEDLGQISEAINNSKHGNSLSDKTKEAISDAVKQEFSDISNTVSEIDSESTLRDYIGIFEKLGKSHSISEIKIVQAVEEITTRIDMLQQESEELKGRAPSSNSEKKDLDQFDDNAILNLFLPLLNTI